ncbi:MAG: triose-phosphate isomerase [Bacteroidia bacterium]
MRRKIVAGNWKMNLNKNEAFSLFNRFKQTKFPFNTEAIIFPPSVYLMQMSDSEINVGAQNCYYEKNGAFTGEISAEMLSSLGVKYCLVGHSERREYFKESDKELSKKVDALLAHNITPVFCFGEKLEDREKNRHHQVVLNQLTKALFHLSPNEISKLILAYEPVWAIGTGKTATSAQAQEMHHFVRNFIAENKGLDTANDIKILYGGSCKPSNAEELFSCADVDGGLIGGASLIYDDFLKLIDIASKI